MKKNFCSRGPIRLGLGITLFSSLMLMGQATTVTGIVTQKGIPLSGVSVSQEGATEIALTNSSGKYQIQIVGENPILIFRYNDYDEKRVKVGSNHTINIDFKQKVEALEEVVVNAGYYKVKEKESTGSIARVTAKDIENQPVNNVLSAVQGRMAGVSITQNSGTPGSGVQIQIRGKNSLRSIANSGIDGNQPLYIIDGAVLGGDLQAKYAGTILSAAAINPLNNINFNEIESIEILKDADATAIYGSRGANGVVLITTKKAKSRKLNINVKSSYGLSHIINNLKMMNTEQYLDMRQQAFNNSKITVYPVSAYDINGKWDKDRSTDWAKTLLGHTSDFSDNSISLRGGDEITSFNLSFGHNEQSTAFGSDFKYKKNNVTSSLSHRSKDTRFQLSLSNAYNEETNNLVNSDITRQGIILAPNSPMLYTPTGELNWENNTFTNPIAIYNSTYSYKTRQFLSSFNAQYKTNDRLWVKLTGGFSYLNFNETSLIPHTVNNPSFGMTSAFSQSFKNNQNRLSINLEPQLNYKFIYNRHEFDILIGATYQHDIYQQEGTKGVGFDSNALMGNIAAAYTKTVFDQISTPYKYAAFFGRFNYKLDAKYIINLTGRRDGSSRFGPNNKFANFGAVGFAWLFSKENWLKETNWLSFGKLRGSFGTSGSDNIGDFQYLDTYIVSSLVYNGITGLQPSKLFNPNFSWEKTRKLEGAIEVGFWDNKINFTSAWYRNISSNQLIGYQLPAITGFTSVLANLPAMVENKGWEFELNLTPFPKSQISWTSHFNVSIPKNKLLDFIDLEGSTYANQYVIGQPISIAKVYQLEGIDTATGKYIFKDFNGDGKITAPDDNKVIENIGVKYFGGWSNTLSYKQWQLSFLFQFVKQKSRNYNFLMPSPGLMSNLPVDVIKNVWSESNPTGLYMPYLATVNPQHTLFQNSTAAISDASFIRLKSIEIAFDIPLKNSWVNTVKIFVHGQNLLTFTRYFGMDPEFAPMPGFLPPLKTISIGTNINF
ncbi:SusC/RagA family TonB-linked outer membrane protein [Soonwooa purpurea]